MRIANDIADFLSWSDRHKGEWVGTIRSKVLVDLPCSSEIMRSFYKHGSWSKGFKCGDQMGEVEFGFQIESYGDLFNAIFSLPPRLLPASANSVKFISLVLGKVQNFAKYLDTIFSTAWYTLGLPRDCGLESQKKHFFFSCKWLTIQYRSIFFRPQVEVELSFSSRPISRLPVAG